MGVDQEVPNYEEENKMLRKNLLKESSVVQNLTKKIKNTEKNVERAVRQEVKKRLLDFDKGDKENLEIISTKGNVIQVKKTKVIVEQNTGRKRQQAVPVLRHSEQAQHPRNSRKT